MTQTDREELVRHITGIAAELYRAVGPSLPPEWLLSDLTVAQLRVMLVLYTEGPMRMSVIATTISVAVSTATGIVDNLVKKGLVARGADPEDRRLVICSLSPQGRGMIEKLWTQGRFQFEKLLDGLTLEQLRNADEVARLLFENISQKNASVARADGGE
jgi:DNA-binding MarR family transcriptional regulator